MSEATKSNKYWENETPTEVKTKGINIKLYNEAGKIQLTTYNDDNSRKGYVVTDRFTAKRLLDPLKKFCSIENPQKPEGKYWENEKKPTS